MLCFVTYFIDSQASPYNFFVSDSLGILRELVAGSPGSFCILRLQKLVTIPSQALFRFQKSFLRDKQHFVSVCAENASFRVRRYRSLAQPVDPKRLANPPISRLHTKHLLKYSNYLMSMETAIPETRSHLLHMGPL